MADVAVLVVTMHPGPVQVMVASWPTGMSGATGAGNCMPRGGMAVTGTSLANTSLPSDLDL